MLLLNPFHNAKLSVLHRTVYGKLASVPAPRCCKSFYSELDLRMPPLTHTWVYLRSRMNLHVGVLHYTPSCEPFPLLADPEHYEPNTLDMGADNAFPVDQYRRASQVQGLNLKST